MRNAETSLFFAGRALAVSCAIFCAVIVVATAAPAHADGYEFSASVRAARATPAAFAAQIVRDNAGIIASELSDLRICEEHLRFDGQSEQARSLESDLARLSIPQRESPEATNSTPSIVDLAARLSLRESARLAIAVAGAHERWARVCEAASHWHVGSARYERQFELTLRALSHEPTRARLRQVLTLLRSRSGSVALDLADQAMSWVPEGILAKVPEFRSTAFRRYLLALLRDPIVRNAFEIALAIPVAEFEAAAKDAFALAVPYRIHHSGAELNDDVYPFVRLFREELFAKAAIRNCVSRIQDLPDVQLSNSHARHFRLLRSIRRSCPEISEADAQALLAVNDRSHHWALPHSALVVLNSILAQVTDSTGEDELRARVFRDFAPIERFTAELARRLRPTNFHHLTTASYLGCRLHEKWGDSNRVALFTNLMAIGYQIVDTPIKLRRNVNLDAIVKDSLSDIVFWDVGGRTCSTSP